jgi:hypothetical protein
VGVKPTRRLLQPEATGATMEVFMGELKLTVNEEKTRICKVPEDEFDFLGYTFGQMYSAKTGRPHLGMRPSKKSIRRMVEKIHGLAAHSMTWQSTKRLLNTPSQHSVADLGMHLRLARRCTRVD